MLLPAIQYAWSGERLVPLRIEVFDASTGRPIPGARITVMIGQRADARERVRFHDGIHELEIEGRQISHGTTDEGGQVFLSQKFPSGGSHRSSSHGDWVALNAGWVFVSAPQYGSAVISVRAEPVRRNDLVNAKEVLVLIGLKPAGSP